MTFSIIIPNFNGDRFLAGCLHSLLFAFKLCPQAEFEIILVDNGSTDDSINHAQKIFPQIKIIAFPANQGFAAAVNAGINKSVGDYLVICNNDLTVDKNYFKLIFQAVQKYPEAACFCGTVLNHDGSRIESQGISFNYSGKCLLNHHGQKFTRSQPRQSITRPVWGSTAALVVYKKSVLKKIGGFDKKYFAYLEDLDVAFRLQKYGFRTLLVPSALCRHLGGGTADSMGSFRARQTWKNWFIFIAKNYTFYEIVNNFPSLFLERLRNFSYLVRSILLKSKQ